MEGSSTGFPLDSLASLFGHRLEDLFPGKACSVSASYNSPYGNRYQNEYVPSRPQFSTTQSGKRVYKQLAPPVRPPLFASTGGRERIKIAQYTTATSYALDAIAHGVTRGLNIHSTRRSIT